MPRRPLGAPLRAAFAELVNESMGLSFAPHRLEALDRGVHRATAALGLADPWNLLERLRAGDGGAFVALADHLTVGETYFFRDPQHFALLRELLREAEGPVALWSAGCASGAEPYSMAIMALELFGDRAAERVEITATDISEQALARAREGLYRPWAFRGVDEATMNRWFTREGDLRRVVEPVRDMVRFRRLNLVEPDDPAWPSSIAVAFCRNVLVYFDQAPIARAAEGMRRALAPGGWLIVGPSDPLLSSFGLRVDASGGFIAYREPSGAAAPRAPASPAAFATGTFAGADPAADLDAAAEVAMDATPSPAVVAESDGVAPPITTEGGGAEESAAAEVLGRARALADAGDSAAALADVDEVIAAEPLLAEAYVLRATLRQVLGDHRAALTDIRRALLLDRSQIFAHVLAAPSYLALADADGARRSLRNARAFLGDLDPDEPVPSAAGASVAELMAACAQLERSVEATVG